MTHRHPDYDLEAGRSAELAWTAEQLVAATGLTQAIAFDAGDDVLFKLALTVGGASLLDLSRTPNANGSQVVVDELGDTSDLDPDNWVPASGRVLLDQADTAGLATTKNVWHYDELLLQDSGDSDRLKTICRGRVLMKPSQT